MIKQKIEERVELKFRTVESDRKTDIRKMQLKLREIEVDHRKPISDIH